MTLATRHKPSAQNAHRASLATTSCVHVQGRQSSRWHLETQRAHTLSLPRGRCDSGFWSASRVPQRSEYRWHWLAEAPARRQQARQNRRSPECTPSGAPRFSASGMKILDTDKPASRRTVPLFFIGYYSGAPVTHRHLQTLQPSYRNNDR